MKVVYKKPIVERIAEAKQEAREQGKEIDYIELSKKEREEIISRYAIESLDHTFKEFRLMEVEIKVVEEEV